MVSLSAMLPLVMACRISSCSWVDRLRWDVSGAALCPEGEGSTPCSQGWASISSRLARLEGSLCSILEIRLRERERKKNHPFIYLFSSISLLILITPVIALATVNYSLCT